MLTKVIKHINKLKYPMFSTTAYLVKYLVLKSVLSGLGPFVCDYLFINSVSVRFTITRLPLNIIY